MVKPKLDTRRLKDPSKVRSIRGVVGQGFVRSVGSEQGTMRIITHRHKHTYIHTYITQHNIHHASVFAFLCNVL